MGTHISKVKSIDLDIWTGEQMDVSVFWGAFGWFWGVRSQGVGDEGGGCFDFLGGRWEVGTGGVNGGERGGAVRCIRAHM